MNKTLKKSVFLILAILLTFSIGLFAFAADSSDSEATPISKEDAEFIAVEYIRKNTCRHITSDDIYSDGVYYNNKEVYKVMSIVTLEDNTGITYITYVDKYTGRVYDRTAKYALPIATIFTPLTEDEAFDYVLKALCAIEDKVVVLKKQANLNKSGKVESYSFEFAENFYEHHKCTIYVNNGDMEDIEISVPTNIVDRIVLLIRVLTAKFFGLLPFSN